MVLQGFSKFFTKSFHNCENYGFFGLKIGKIILSLIFIERPLKIYPDQNGELVYYDFNIIYKHFESASTKADNGRS